MIERNKIYCEDCLVGMGKMADESVDLIITSPPYNKAGYEGFIRKRHSNGTWQQGRNIEYLGDASNDFMKEAEYQAWQVKVLNECARVLKKDGSIFYNHKIRVAKHKASHPIEWILKSNLVFRQQIIWNRKSSPNVHPIRFIPSTELVFWLTKTATQPNFLRNDKMLFGSEVWEIIPKADPTHPAPMPEEIPRNIIAGLKEKKGVVVLDPFAGKGTTLIEAIRAGVDYIGFEKAEKYFKETQENIKKISVNPKEYIPLELFG